jgi:hypothetical protein
MKQYFLFALVDLLIVLVYPFAYIINFVHKHKGTKLEHRRSG